MSKKSVFSIMFAALLLIWPAIYNGFPLIFPDSGDYISNKGYIYRPAFYSFFISISSLRISLFLSVYIQALIVSHLIWILLKSLFGKVENVTFLAFTFILAILSSLPFFSSYILADFFTAIAFLCIYILIFARQSISKIEQIYIFIIAIFCAIAHVSNLYITLGLIIFFYIFGIGKHDSKEARLQDLKQGMRPLIRGFVILFLINLIGYKSFSPAPAGGIFIFANFIENGPAKKMLAENCSKNQFKICQYLNEIPNNGAQFLWGENSINYKLGEFEGFAKEANELVRFTIFKYPKEILFMAINNFKEAAIRHNPLNEAKSSQQLVEFNDILEKNYGKPALKQYLSSKEMQDSLPYSIVKKIDDIAFPISIFTMSIFLLLNLKDKRNDKFILPLSIIIFIFGDFLLCSFTSGIYDRYQARVTWLGILGALICLRFWFLKTNLHHARQA